MSGGGGSGEVAGEVKPSEARLKWRAREIREVALGALGMRSCAGDWGMRRGAEAGGSGRVSFFLNSLPNMSRLARAEVGGVSMRGGCG